LKIGEVSNDFLGMAIETAATAEDFGASARDFENWVHEVNDAGPIFGFYFSKRF